MGNIDSIIAAAWSVYIADPRLNAPPFEGSAQQAPNDLGAFKAAMMFAEEIRERHIIRAYRHYQNEFNLAGKPKQEAFASGIRLMYAELGT